MSNAWTLQLAQTVVRYMYTLPRGQAAVFSDALAVLRTNPTPAGCQPLSMDDLPNAYVVKLGEYRIGYQVLERQRVIRVFVVE
jgi:mRNA-degrading endonuclease RelE of RelBE toxin-antitoxin system